MPSTPKAVVLLSGGLDSATTLAIARGMGFDLYALSFSYGQRQTVELASARLLAAEQDVIEHRILNLDLGNRSALTGDYLIPKGRSTKMMAAGVPITYVPARNTVFLAHALSWAESLGAYDIYIGVNAVDYSGYPDCRPQFIAAFERLANLGTAAGVDDGRRITIHAPLVKMTKAEIIACGDGLGVDYSHTHTCYDPDSGLACGDCDACILRRQGFEQAGIADPTRYVPTEEESA